MKRILCIRFPHWPLQRLFNAQPALRRKAVAIYEERRGRWIVASNQRGVVPGMPVAEAGDAHLERHDPAVDLATLKRIAQWCEQFSPLVGLEEGERPESLFLDVTGLTAIFGSEEALAERVVRAFARRGLSAQVAIADTLGAAWAATHGDETPRIVAPGDFEALLHLPTTALRLPPKTTQTLAELGIQSIGQLLSLPRDGLAARLGHKLIDRLDQFTGQKAEAIDVVRVLPEIVCERQFDYPIENREVIDVAMAQLVEQAAAELTRRQQGAVQLECLLTCQEEAIPLAVGLYEACCDARHLLGLLRTQFERRLLTSPVLAVRVAVLQSAKLVYRQRELFSANHKHDREFALLIDRVSSRLGREAVLRATLAADAQPEYAYRYEILAGNAKRQLATEPRPLPKRPLFVESRPIPLEVLAIVPGGPPMQFRLNGQPHRTRRTWGPERIQTGWWRGRYIRRDYYRVESESGHCFWLFCSKGKWFLHGVFD
jgi:protein ImuB